MINQKCALIDGNGNCRLMNVPAVDNCRCPHYTSVEPAACRFCGAHTLDPLLFEAADGSFDYICGNCKQKSGTCALCEKGRRCLYQEYSGPLPQMIMQTIRQGNAIMQTQVPNPEVIRATCHFCECWDGEGCGREFGTCGKYQRVQV